eukprot:scaffold36842_cov39-Phaeocystis_antarctica.AAC.1
MDEAGLLSSAMKMPSPCRLSAAVAAPPRPLAMHSSVSKLCWIMLAAAPCASGRSVNALRLIIC